MTDAHPKRSSDKLLGRMKHTVAIALPLLFASFAAAQTKPSDLMEKAKPSLVVVQFTYAGELGRRDFAGMGTVVREDGLVMFSQDLTPRGLPDEQMTDFKLMLPGDPETEIDAEFLGRDERYGVSYVKPKADDRKWTPITFVDVAADIGESVHAVGLLPKIAGYNVYFTTAPVAANLRGPVPQALVAGGGLSVIGSPVFNDKGEAIGFVNSQPERTVLLNDPRAPYATVENPARLYTPARDFIPSLAAAPKAGEPIKIPFMGISQLTGLSKNVAEFYGLAGQVAIQVGDVIPGFSAERAGLKKGHIIISLEGKPLERGDLPEEAPQILTRRLSQKNVGDKVTLGVITEKGAEPKNVEITLDERPAQANKAARFYAEDLGFTTRDAVFEDTYVRKLPRDSKGVAVTFIRPQSAAQAAEMQLNDFVTQVNQTPVESVKQFEDTYKAFRKDRPNEPVVLEVLRQGNTQIIRIEPPRG